MVDDPSMPPQPTTTQLPAVAPPPRVDILKPETPGLSEVLGKLAAAVDRVESKQDAGFVAVKADFNLLAGQFEGLEKDVRGLQSWRVRTDDWRAQNETRASNNSLRVQSVSSTSLEQDSKIANEIIARQALAKDVSDTKEELAALRNDTNAQTKILVGMATDVQRFLATPTVKIVGGVLAGSVLTWIAQHFGITLPR